MRYATHFERLEEQKERKKITADSVLLPALHDGTRRRSPPLCSKLSPLVSFKAPQIFTRLHPFKTRCVVEL